MAEKTEEKYRYPGVDYFTEDDTDIFCGRKEDTRKFLIKIMLNRTVVLHGDSGVGKSSLMQAGLIPEIKRIEKKEKYFPVTIRFEGNKTNARSEDVVSKRGKDTLVIELISEIKKAFPTVKKNLPYLAFREDRLWYWLKALEVEGCCLVLIFDQFEQLQSYSNDQIQKFKESLSEAFSDIIPQDIYDEMKDSSKNDLQLAFKDHGKSVAYGEKMARLETPLRTKAVFVLREDKLGTMSLLADAFPDILKNDYLLKQLSMDNARKSILEPTLLTKGKFLSEFKYAPGAEVNLLKSLVDEQSQLIDPLQIQIVCRDIERNVVPGLKTKIVTQADIPKLENVIDSFYWNSWKQQESFFNGNRHAYNEKRNALNELLIVSGKRNLVHRDILVRTQLDQEIIDGLVKQGLLREVPQDQNNLFYQLCHDRFIQPAIEDMLDFETEQEKEALEHKLKAEKEEAESLAKTKADAEKKELEVKAQRLEGQAAQQRAKFYRTGLIGLIVIVVLGIGTVFFWLNDKKNQEEAGYLIAVKSLRRDNPTLSYEVARDWVNTHPRSEVFNDFISTYDSARFSYLIESIPSGAEAIYARTDSACREILIVNNAAATLWNRDGYIKDENLRGSGTILKRILVGQEEAFLIEEGNKIKCVSNTGKLLNEFIWEGGTISVVANSSDGRYLLVEKVLFDLQKAAVMGELPNYGRTKDEMSAVFMHDNKHFAVGYWSGDIIIFSLEKTDDVLTPVKWFLPQFMNSVVSALAVGNNDEILISGDRSAEIRIWPVGKLADKISLDIVQENPVSEPIRILKGHLAQINCISVSNDGRFILSGGDDHQAIMWGADNGKRISVLKGTNYNVTYVDFSTDGRIMITSTDNGDVQLWSHEKASILYNLDLMHRFSPFEYYESGLNFSIAELSDAMGVKKLFGRTINSIAAMPMTNQFPEDNGYIINLKLSIDAVNEYHMKLINHRSYKDSITNPNKKLLLKTYVDFLYMKVPELLLQTEDETKDERSERVLKHHLASAEFLLLPDTTEITVAVAYLEDFLTISEYYQRDSVKKYSKSKFYLDLAIDKILTPYLRKYPNKPEILDKEVNLNLSIFQSYLYGNKPDSAIMAVKVISAIKKAKGMANWCLINTYLSMDQFDKALDLYKKGEFFTVYLDGYSLKDYMEAGLKWMKDHDISNESTRRFVAFLNTRESPDPAKLKDYPPN